MDRAGMINAFVKSLEFKSPFQVVDSSQNAAKKRSLTYASASQAVGKVTV